VAEVGQEAAEWEQEAHVLLKVEASAPEAEAVEASVTVAAEVEVEASVIAAEVAAVASAVAIAVEVEAEVQASKCCLAQMSLRWTWKRLRTGKERPRIRQLRKRRKRSG
jgi:hypothetical protein